MAGGGIVAGLDIGTTKTACVVAELNEEYEPQIIGVGTSPVTGTRKGMIVNLEEAVDSVVQAVEDAERMANVHITSVTVGIAGDHIQSARGRGIIAVTGNGNEVMETDVRRVLDSASTMIVPADRHIIHILPQSFSVDDQLDIKDPTGMTGSRLEAEVHVITAATSCHQNILKTVVRAGLRVDEVVMQPLATSQAILDSDELELGVVLLDIGGGATDVAVFINDHIRQASVIGLGGNSVTNDIAIGLRTPMSKAEQLKTENGSAIASLAADKGELNVPGVGGRPDRSVSADVLGTIIEARMEEILNLCLKELTKTSYLGLVGAGVVLTGGGSSLPGTAELAEQVLDLPARVGIPHCTGGIAESAQDPGMATGVGLVRCAARRLQQSWPTGRDRGTLGRLWGGMRRIVGL